MKKQFNTNNKIKFGEILEWWWYKLHIAFNPKVKLHVNEQLNNPKHAALFTKLFMEFNKTDPAVAIQFYRNILKQIPKEILTHYTTEQLYNVILKNILKQKLASQDSWQILEFMEDQILKQYKVVVAINVEQECCCKLIYCMQNINTEYSKKLYQAILEKLKEHWSKNQVLTHKQLINIINYFNQKVIDDFEEQSDLTASSYEEIINILQYIKQQIITDQLQQLKNNIEENFEQAAIIWTGSKILSSEINWLIDTSSTMFAEIMSFLKKQQSLIELLQLVELEEKAIVYQELIPVWIKLLRFIIKIKASSVGLLLSPNKNSSQQYLTQLGASLDKIYKINCKGFYVFDNQEKLELMIKAICDFRILGIQNKSQQIENIVTEQLSKLIKITNKKLLLFNKLKLWVDKIRNLNIKIKFFEHTSSKIAKNILLLKKLSLTLDFNIKMINNKRAGLVKELDVILSGELQPSSPQLEQLLFSNKLTICPTNYEMVLLEQTPEIISKAHELLNRTQGIFDKHAASKFKFFM